MIIDGESRKLYEDEGSFGDMALMYNAPRSASIIFRTDAQMLALSSQTFKKVLRKIKLKQSQTNLTFLKEANIFKNLSAIDINKLAEESVVQIYKPGNDLGKYMMM